MLQVMDVEKVLNWFRRLFWLYFGTCFRLYENTLQKIYLPSDLSSHTEQVVAINYLKLKLIANFQRYQDKLTDF